MPPTHGLGVSKKSFCLSAANKELDESQIAKAIKPKPDWRPGCENS